MLSDRTNGEAILELFPLYYSIENITFPLLFVVMCIVLINCVKEFDNEHKNLCDARQVVK